METFISLVAEYGLFLAKAVTIVVAIGVVLSWIISATQQVRQLSGEALVVRNINDRLRNMADTIYNQTLNKTERKARNKQQKAQAKQKDKAAKLGKSSPKNRLFVIDFEGDIRASAVENLREEISAILLVAEANDEVLIKLESPGGMVHTYGLAASQLRRLRDHGITLTASVDKLAASGGYLMACVADKIVAAPFAIIGSIGVVAQLPNFNRLMKEKNIDYELHTAGNHKRTLTMLGENTEEGRAKFREEIEETHGLFKEFVSHNRPDLDIEKVATGEHWYGSQALDLKLVDELKTSDDYLLSANRDEREIFSVTYKTKATLMDKISDNVSIAIRRTTDAVLSRAWRGNH